MSIKALDDIQTLLTAMKDRGAEMKAFEGLLNDISSSLSDIVSILEGGVKGGKPAPDIGKAIADAIAKIKAPEVKVNVQPTPVTVQPAAVHVTPSDWKSLRVRVGKSADGSKEFKITKE